MPSTKPTYRGELLPDLAKLTPKQIATRIRFSSVIDREIRAVLRGFTVRTPDEKAALDAYAALLDLGLASIAQAEHGTEVQLYTLNVVVAPGARKSRRG